MKKSVKILLAIGITISALILIAVSTFLIITAGTNLQPEKLVDYGKTITIYDDEGNKIEDTSLITKQKTVKVNDLQQHTINAFIASEDRDFYKHDGLNYKRILKATYKNIISRSFKEGASTISQQLVKNTHLSNDKTIARKLKEIKLTKQLERSYSKDDILEMYLNTIYFGHNCFGLQSAANFYFDKPANELSLEQSATVVGLLTSPNNFSPFKNPQKCVARRNIVLKNMLDCGYIDENEYKNAVDLPLSATESNSNKYNLSYINAVFDELDELKTDPYGEFSELKIYTYLNKNIQNTLQNRSVECDYSYFVRNALGGVAALKTNIGNAKRPIGSTAKPIFVYAPAINDKKIDIFTKICDEPINYGGYSPENFDKKYHGEVSVADSIKYSYNIPAVKTLNSLSFENVQNYADKMGIAIKDEDKNLSLALGGMSEGISLKQLCDAYSTFQNQGEFSSSKFIKEICDQNGKILYKNQTKKQKVFENGTSSLINDVLMQTAKSGTAKKLKDFKFDVACKTGTCGNKDGNTDAYAVAYTSDLCVGVWLGDKDNKKIQVMGGTDCCKEIKDILTSAYSNYSPAELDKTGGTSYAEIDREEYEQNGKILLCDENCPALNRLKVKCLTDNLPKERSYKFTKPKIQKPNIIVVNNTVNISLCQTKYYSYLIKRGNNGKIDEVYDGKWTKTITDTPSDGEYVYSVTPYFKNEKGTFFGDEIVLSQVCIRHDKPEDKIPDIAFKDWYNQ